MVALTLSDPNLGTLAPGTQVGKYELVKLVAMGGMAELYLARALGIEGFEKLVALKRILPQHATRDEFVRMFLDEARLAATLHHPNIAQVYDIGVASGTYFFTMEYVHGEDLRQMLRAAHKAQCGVPVEHSLLVIQGLCAGLHAAHEKRGPDGMHLQIVHRDVSPSNVLISFDGTVKVVDFGIAKAATHDHETRAGTLKGKIAYMSPEQCRGEKLDRRSDVFSIGILLYELTTGLRLYKGDGDFAVLSQIVHEDAPPPTQRRPGYPVELERIVLRALSRDRDARYATAEELQLDIEQFVRARRLETSSVRLGQFLRRLFPGRAEDAPVSGLPRTRRPTLDVLGDAHLPELEVPVEVIDVVSGSRPTVTPFAPGCVPQSRARSAPRPGSERGARSSASVMAVLPPNDVSSQASSGVPPRVSQAEALQVTPLPPLFDGARPTAHGAHGGHGPHRPSVSRMLPLPPPGARGMLNVSGADFGAFAALAAPPARVVSGVSIVPHLMNDGVSAQNATGVDAVAASRGLAEVLYAAPAPVLSAEPQARARGSRPAVATFEGDDREAAHAPSMLSRDEARALVGRGAPPGSPRPARLAGTPPLPMRAADVIERGPTLVPVPDIEHFVIEPASILPLPLAARALPGAFAKRAQVMALVIAALCAMGLVAWSIAGRGASHNPAHVLRPGASATVEIKSPIVLPVLTPAAALPTAAPVHAEAAALPTAAPEHAEATAPPTAAPVHAETTAPPTAAPEHAEATAPPTAVPANTIAAALPKVLDPAALAAAEVPAAEREARDAAGFAERERTAATGDVIPTPPQPASAASARRRLAPATRDLPTKREAPKRAPSASPTWDPDSALPPQ